MFPLVHIHYLLLSIVLPVSVPIPISFLDLDIVRVPALEACQSLLTGPDHDLNLFLDSVQDADLFLVLDWWDLDWLDMLDDVLFSRFI